MHSQRRSVESPQASNNHAWLPISTQSPPLEQYYYQKSILGISSKTFFWKNSSCNRSPERVSLQQVQWEQAFTIPVNLKTNLLGPSINPAEFLELLFKLCTLILQFHYKQLRHHLLKPCPLFLKLIRQSRQFQKYRSLRTLGCPKSLEMMRFSGFCNNKLNNAECAGGNY